MQAKLHPIALGSLVFWALCAMSGTALAQQVNGSVPATVVPDGSVVSVTGYSIPALRASGTTGGSPNTIIVNGAVTAQNLDGTGQGVAEAERGGFIDLGNGSTLNAVGTGEPAGIVGATGLIASGAGSKVVANNLTINTSSDNPYGAYALDGGSVALDGLTTVNLTVAGKKGFGLIANNGSTLTAQDFNYVANGTTGLYVEGLNAYNDSSVTVAGTANVSIAGDLASAYGIEAGSGGQVNVNNLTANIDTPNGTGILVSVSNKGGALVAGTVDATVNGDTVYGVALSGSGNAQLTGNGSITLNGSAWAGGLAIFNSTADAANIELDNARLSVNGGDPNGIYSSGTGPASFLVQNSTIASAGDGVQVVNANTTIDFVNSTLTNDSGLAIDVRSGRAPGMLNFTLDQGSSITGTAQVAADSTSNLTLLNGSTWDMTGDSALTNLTNNGSTIAFAAPGAFKTLNVLGDYAGANGTIVLNTRLDQGGALAGQQTDRVLIGGNASGTTLLDVKATPDSPGGLTSPTGTLGAAEGISVAQVGGTSSMNVFQLKGGYALAPNSPYAYQLYAYGPGSTYGGADPAASLVGNAAQYWDYRLQSAYVTPDGPIDPPDVDPGGNGGGDSGGGGTGGGDHTPVPPDARPAVAPQVPAYLSAPVMFQFATLGDLDALHRRLGEIRDEGNDAPGEMFVRAWGGNFNYASNQSFRNFGYNATGDYGAVQIGGNLYRLRTENGVWRFGAAASVGWLHYEPNAVDGPSSSRSTTWRVAGYGTYQSTKGWYVDNILSVGGFNGSVSTAAHANAFSLEGQSYAASVEAGYPFALGWKGVNVEPQVQVIAQHLSFRNGTDADGLDVNIGSQNQVTGRLGVRMTRPFVAKGGAKVTPYVAIDYLHSFNGGTTVQVGDAGFQTGSLGDAMQYTVGINSALNQKFSVFARASYQQRIGNAGFRGVLVNGGVRYRF